MRWHRHPPSSVRCRFVTTILLVEDDERISEPLLRVLGAEGFEVVHAATGTEGLAVVTARRPDLMLLDLTLPDIDGLDVCRKVREDRPEMPIIMLTARAEEMDVIVGLGAGADDYVPKPFRLAELVAAASRHGCGLHKPHTRCHAS